MAIVICFAMGGQKAKHDRIVKKLLRLPDPRSRDDEAIRRAHFAQPEMDTFVVLQLRVLFDHA